MKDEFTDLEKRILLRTVDLVEDFQSLPKEHPMQDSEFVSAIHRVQDLILARLGARVFNSGDEDSSSR